MTGRCACGCGQPTPIATKTSARDGWIKGQPIKYVHGHNGRQPRRLPDGQRKAARSGWCACGCGQRTTVPTKSSTADGRIAGRPVRFISGHNTRGVSVAVPTDPREAHAERLLHASELLVAAVHDEGPDEVIVRLRAALAVPAPDGVDPVVALVTVLAAQIDIDAPASRRLAWTTLPPPRTPTAAPQPEESAA